MKKKEKLNLYLALGNIIGEKVFNAVLKNPYAIIDIVFWDGSNNSKKVSEQCIRKNIKFELSHTSPILVKNPKKPYLFICAGFGYILNEKFLSYFKKRAYNIHTSLLPSYRGRNALQWSIVCGESIIGCTVHRLSSQIDAGDIIYQKKIKVGLEKNLQDISQRLADIGAQLCNRLIRDCHKDKIRDGLRQYDSIYWRRRRPQDGKIDWKDISFKIINKVRASCFSYPAFTKKTNGTKIIIKKCVVVSVPGLVLRAYPNKNEYVVSSGDGVVMIETEKKLKEGDKLV